MASDPHWIVIHVLWLTASWKANAIMFSWGVKTKSPCKLRKCWYESRVSYHVCCVWAHSHDHIHANWSERRRPLSYIRIWTYTPHGSFPTAANSFLDKSANTIQGSAKQEDRAHVGRAVGRWITPHRDPRNAMSSQDPQLSQYSVVHFLALQSTKQWLVHKYIHQCQNQHS